MILRKSIQDIFTKQCLLLLALVAVPLSVLGQSTTWQVKVGSQVPDCLVGAPSNSKLAEGCQAHQAIAFLPNEIWVHQNDSITWTQATEENHTVTFVYEPQPTTLGVGPYPAAQQRPSNAVGCSAYGGVTSANNSAYDPSGAKGLQCVNSGVLPSYGSTYTISFPAQGNFTFTCLIHSSMNGIVHVLDPCVHNEFPKHLQNPMEDLVDALLYLGPNDLTMKEQKEQFPAYIVLDTDNIAEVRRRESVLPGGAPQLQKLVNVCASCPMKSWSSLASRFAP